MMKKIKITLLLIVAIFTNISCQVFNKNYLLNKADTIYLPININSFSNFSSIEKNSINEYNEVVKNSKGYIDSKGKFHKATEIYSTDIIIRTHEKQNEGEIITYELSDSVKVGIVGRVNMSNDYICVLVKIQDIPNDFQKAYYYKLLCFDKKGNHLSTIKVFELIDDVSTKDWIKVKPSPNVTSKFMEDKSIQIKWDEGYNEYYIQYVKLNSDGIFVVEKLEEIKK